MSHIFNKRVLLLINKDNRDQNHNQINECIINQTKDENKNIEKIVIQLMATKY